jgi:hypothetical protein
VGCELPTSSPPGHQLPHHSLFPSTLSPFLSSSYKRPLPQLLCFDTLTNARGGIPPRTLLSRIKMTQKQANSNSTNDPSRCQHLFVNGTRCRLLVPNADSLFCPLHAKLPEHEHELADLSPILTRDCRSFQTAQGINHSISELYLLLAQNRISSRRDSRLHCEFAPPHAPRYRRRSRSRNHPQQPRSRFPRARTRPNEKTVMTNTANAGAKGNRWGERQEKNDGPDSIFGDPPTGDSPEKRKSSPWVPSVES